MRPKKSPAPGIRRSSNASPTVASMYSWVISSDAPDDGSRRSRRSIIASRQRLEYTSCACSACRSGKTSAPATGATTLARHLFVDHVDFATALADLHRHVTRAAVHRGAGPQRGGGDHLSAL